MKGCDLVFVAFLFGICVLANVHQAASGTFDPVSRGSIAFSTNLGPRDLVLRASRRRMTS